MTLKFVSSRFARATGRTDLLSRATRGWLCRLRPQARRQLSHVRLDPTNILDLANANVGELDPADLFREVLVGALAVVVERLDCLEDELADRGLPGDADQWLFKKQWDNSQPIRSDR